MPSFKSLIGCGALGSSVATVEPVNESSTTVSSPTRMPANAPARVAHGTGRRLRTTAGNSWVTKL